MAGLFKGGCIQAGIILYILSTLPSFAIAGTYSGGSGTAEDPYKISTADDWQELANNPFDWQYHFILSNDLDFEGAIIAPIGFAEQDQEGNLLGAGLTGVFNGNGYSIRKLTLSSQSSICIGLFRWIGPGGQVTNLKLIDVIASGYWGVGGLCGYIDSGTITDCHVSGYVMGDLSAGILCGYNHNGTIDRCSTVGEASGAIYSTGGLCGVNYFGTISNSYSTGTVNGRSYVGGLCGANNGTIERCFATGSAMGEIECMGGLCGANDGTIRNCYARGDVTGNDRYNGGLCGASKGTIQYCYSTGKVSGGILKVGGLCGGIPATVIDSFWDMETSGQTVSAGGIGKTTAEMKTLTTFTDAGWDFVGESTNGTSDAWRMCGDGVSYPRLSWEFSAGGDLDCPDGVELEDLLYLAGRWLAATPEAVGTADANGDGKANLADLAIVSENWR